ncbi:dihydrolipoamide acetyltransferase family protein [Tuwongella immobilis]|uniref:Dihydrolipoamide acetyltransferase component of pyruvate dehydrogenase complex n=1 Tax=Tuwongella immobilis TaxID=692036 RepID=A0A6C2YLD7_9BACT|nr:dihydrolipoamide acetyltransferase family protein [Tuwongella immobilis]VIP02121.1 branched-chain alpha-keto acid dehydrogenase subunit e2 : Uncultured bacterium genome assembly Metasoil_fosmids_resub OS=uncultured bacterium PE=4 SV=1: Biotin_lipoyl: E3_binding: 2-oxoacid_dh [Tuwongella immobilis]VTS00449.1 branched-chain alpha-keto acid dehydrogenase subunit e2 : Uncultured bacterium genome assembly Metasoil_fosmids_resub OS=uncultured bacterium PE=4 SV=1: Biotin_lipoyl: E3_binding: 2-oxoacid
MEFRVPQLGEGVYEAEVVRWRVTVGQTVRSGQPLLEVMTDKATMDVPAPFQGTITRLLLEPGQRVPIGTVMLEFTPTVTESLPLGGPSPSLYATTGSNPNPELPRAVTPPPNRIVLRSNDPQTVPMSHPQSRPTPAAAPSVRHLARKLGIDLNTVSGTGPGGRILMDDVLSATPMGGAGADRGDSSMPPPPLPPLPLMPTPTMTLRGTAGPTLNLGQPGTRIPMHGLRRQMADYLTEVTRRVPQCSLIDECDLTDVVRLRDTLKETLQQQSIKLTYLPFFVIACVRALKEVPLFNSSLDEHRNEIVLHDRYHIGIAVAVPDGVLVPVLRDADQMDIITIAREIERISRAARAGTSSREDLQGGTFTLTSIGGIGGLIATPMVPHPQAAILGIGKIVRRPVYNADDELRSAQMAYLSLSFDHRILDGAIAATFVNAVMRQLQNPARLLLPADLREGIAPAASPTTPFRRSA